MLATQTDRSCQLLRRDGPTRMSDDHLPRAFLERCCQTEGVRRFAERNPGVCLGPQWLPSAEHFASIDPSNERVLGWAGRCTRDQYDLVLNNAVSAFSRWRMVPAPRRGELVRVIVEALRRHNARRATMLVCVMAML